MIEDDAAAKGGPASYTLPHASINEAGTYAHTSVLPGSSNEPPSPIPQVPVLTSLVPNSGTGSGNLRVTVTGKGFADYTWVSVAGVDQPPILISSTQLQMVIKPSNFPKGTYPVTVKNGSYASNPLNFTIT